MITPTDFSDVRWRGHWIWTPSDTPTLSLDTSGAVSTERRSCTVLFRRTVQLDAAPARAPARITADSRYALFVNGRELSRGPVRSQPRRMQYDMVDLAPALQPGLNVVAIVVKYYGRGNSYYMPAVPNTGLGKSGVLVFEADLGNEWLVSDASWQSLLCPAWDFHQADSGNTIEMGVPVEVLDARVLPANWMQPGFEANADDGWRSAQILRAMHIGGYARSQPPTDPYGPLFPRTIAQLSGETATPQSASVQKLAERPDVSVPMPAPRIIRSMKITADTPAAAALPLTIHGGDQRVLFDFGRIVTGAVQLAVRAPAGTIFDLAYTEDRLTGDENGPLAPATGSRYIARGADDVFETFDVNGLRFIYMLVHDADGPVVIEHVAVRERLYPWTPGAFFESSDPAIDRLHRAGVRTVELNSHDAFLDCPTREQRAWVGDSVVHQMVHLATNCDWRLAWQFLFLGASPRYDGILPISVAGDFEAGGGYTIPEWSLHWVHGVYNLYQFAGDADLIKQ